MAGLVSQQTLEQIRSASDIVEVIQSYIPLTSAPGRTSWRFVRSTRKKPPASTSIRSADLPLFRLPQRRRRFHIRQGIREHHVSSKRSGGWPNARKSRSNMEQRRASNKSRHPQGQPPANPRANHPTLAKRARQRSRRTNRARLSRQTRRLRRGDKIVSPRLPRRKRGTTPSTGRKAKATNSRLVEKAGLIIAQGGKAGANVIYDRFRGG